LAAHDSLLQDEDCDCEEQDLLTVEDVLFSSRERKRRLLPSKRTFLLSTCVLAFCLAVFFALVVRRAPRRASASTHALASEAKWCDDPVDPDVSDYGSPNATGDPMVLQVLSYSTPSGPSGSLLAQGGYVAPFDLMGFQDCRDGGKALQDAGVLDLDLFHVWSGGSYAMCMAYRRAVFTELEKGADKVAEDQPGYQGHRMVQWMRLQHKITNRSVIFLNHQGPLPMNSGGLCGGASTAHSLLRVILLRYQLGDAIVLVGDFSADRTSLTVQELAKHLLPVVDGRGPRAGDHIFINAGGARIITTKTLTSAISAVLVLGPVVPKPGSTEPAVVTDAPPVTTTTTAATSTSRTITVTHGFTRTTITTTTRTNTFTYTTTLTHTTTGTTTRTYITTTPAATTEQTATMTDTWTTTTVTTQTTHTTTVTTTRTYTTTTWTTSTEQTATMTDTWTTTTMTTQTTHTTTGTTTRTYTTTTWTTTTEQTATMTDAWTTTTMTTQTTHTTRSTPMSTSMTEARLDASGAPLEGSELVFCEGSSQKLECLPDYVIRIISIQAGCCEGTCGGPGNTYCTSAGTFQNKTKIVEFNCNDKAACTLCIDNGCSNDVNILDVCQGHVMAFVNFECLEAR